MSKLIILLFALEALCLHCVAVVFTRCELVKELLKQNFPERNISDWVCLIEAESGRNTAAISPKLKKGSNDRTWGLFQINSRDWCSTSRFRLKKCKVRCMELRSDNITQASNCAKLIYERHGFEAWTGWVRKCKGKPQPDITEC